MLSGEILSRPPLSVALVPPSNLIQLCRAMAALASLAANQPNCDDIDDVYLENGLLSYENPNYHMNAQRIERNSHLYEEILSELQLQKQQQNCSSKSAKRAAAAMQCNSVDAAELLGDDLDLLLDDGDEAVGQQKIGADMPGSNRKQYARLDVSAMGVDLKENFIAAEKRSLITDDEPSPTELKPHTDNQMTEKDEYQLQLHSTEATAKCDPSTTISATAIATSATAATTIDCSGQGVLNVDDLYALPNKNRNKNRVADADVVPECTSSDEGGDEKGGHEDAEDKDANKDLPPGWEKHEDTNGPYYWHIKSGTIQREPPVWSKHSNSEQQPPVAPVAPVAAAAALPPPLPARVAEPPTPSAVSIASTASSSMGVSINSMNSYYNQMGSSGMSLAMAPPSSSRSQESHHHHHSMSMSVTRSTTSSALDQPDELERRRREELTYKRRSYPLKSDTDRPIRFAVRSMGWVEIAEEDLTPERSSKAVNKCIVDLSLGRNDLLDVVGRWGDGKDLFMDLDDGALKLIDPENLTTLNTQPIHTIRVWGVGRDNGRDFAYVARDRLTRIHMCHVFRCDTTARTIANTLRDICKRIMIERSLQLDASNGHLSSGGRCATRPTDLPTENRQWIRHPAQSFPTPMEEPKKVLKAQYLGSAEVGQPTGIDVLNAAIDSALAHTQPEQWEHVNVAVAPSMISIYSSGPEGRLIAECRVRYLSFLGIGQNVKNCAFIMHTAEDKFVCHTFTCEPSSGALCKTIEAACKLRYQKCLDAHPESRISAESGTPNKGIGATIKTLMSSFTLKKDKCTS